MRDPNALTNLLAAYDSGDHLHPNDAGYQAMANAVNLSLFQGGTSSPFRPSFSTTSLGNLTFGLSWSDTPAGFVLEEAASLTPPVDWQISPLTPVLSNGIFNLSVPVPAAASRFFRLVTTP